MSHMSELARQRDEALAASDYDLIACELSHYKDLCAELVEACKKANTCASLPDYVRELLRAAIKKASK